MKTKFFSPRLYWEKMRQLRTVGFVSMVLCSLLVLIYTFQRSQANASSPFFVCTVGATGASYSSFGTSSRISELTELFPILILVAVSLIFCTALRFNNKRSDSDFYHALPYTRTCQFCSSFAAAQSWILLVILAMTAVFLFHEITALDAPIIGQNYTIDINGSD